MKREPEGIACSFRMKDPGSMVDAYGEHEVKHCKERIATFRCLIRH
jgi:hypothetical protein